MDSVNPQLVRAARDGDAQAWAQLVRSVQDLGVAVAIGHSPSWDDARDATQEAFGVAYAHLSELRDPEAFPGWFAALVRSACSRRSRRRQVTMVPLDEAHLSADTTVDPALVVGRADEDRQVRAAVEALPDRQRSVIALHYLAGLSYPEVGAFLGIGTSAAKKRAFTARRQLKEILPMATDALRDARPSRTTRFSDTILLFGAIRRVDHAAVAALIAKDPRLITATEDWSVAEALQAGLLYAGKASPLIRAAQSGDLAMVRLLVEAGAPVGEACACAGAETALWAATVTGKAEVVAYLLEAGADPNTPAFAGATPLHVAAGRGNDRVRRLLLAAGADPTRLDDHGRTPGDWAPPAAAPDDAGGVEAAMVPTGIRALDLFAPLTRGGLQYWPPAYGLGQFVCIFEIARALTPARCWFVGFAHGPYDHNGIHQEITETGVDATVALTPPDTDPTTRRDHFASTITRLRAAGGSDKLVICLEAPGHAHDVTAALPELAADPTILATIVVAPFTGSYPPVAATLPEGYDGQVAFDTQRAHRHLWPAIDPATTSARAYPSDRHRSLAAAARQVLIDHAASHPTLEPEPGPVPAAARWAAAQRLLDYLAQPFTVTEPITSQPGECTPPSQTLDSVERILAQMNPPTR